MTNFAIIDEDGFYRSELEKVILFQASWNCVLSAASAEDFNQRIRPRVKIDFALIGVQNQSQVEIQLIPFIKKKYPKATVIVLTQSQKRELLFKSLSQGAEGYLLKGFSLFQLPQFIRVYQEGGALISPVMLKHLTHYFNQSIQEEEYLLDLLTNKETQILHLLADGNTYEEIAEITGTSINTVRFHLKNAYKKLNVDNRLDAILKWKGK